MKHKQQFPFFFLIAAVVIPLSLCAYPVDSEVIAGDASFEMSQQEMKITTSERAIIDWHDFSIEKGEKVHFIQPGVSSAVLNRVNSGAISVIEGILESNGKVFLINPNGVLVGPSGMIKTGSFLASTLDIENHTFLKNGDLLFSGDSERPIQNYGTIIAEEGDVILVSYVQEVHGLLESEKGAVRLGAGQEVLIRPGADRALSILVPAEGTEMESGISVNGYIDAVTTEIVASGNAYQFAISHEGTIDATEIKAEAGKVWLIADEGMIKMTGEIAAGSDSAKGEVSLFGDNILLADFAAIAVNAPDGGGSVAIRGGEDENCVASRIYIGNTVEIAADADGFGDGGSISLRAADELWMQGDLTARAGIYGGDGGSIEVLSGGRLVFQGVADVFAPFGTSGNLTIAQVE